MALVSAAIATITTLFTIFNRERGKEAAVLIGQHILIYGTPLLLKELL